ncbi:MAG: AbrB family transcriptional regulator [Magnetococcales bacterium]|nr:AbrB family transcriptional regulator [Magnetococcales bacterium]
MIETCATKPAKNGTGQTIHLPKGYCFEGREDYIMQDDATDQVMFQSDRPEIKLWNELFELLHSIDAPADFMTERPMNVLPQSHGIFDDNLSPSGKRSS